MINFALPEVRGQHFAYSSQDDFFSPDWLDSMIKRSEETNAGAIVPDMVYFSGSGSDHTLSGLDGNREVVLSNREAVEASLSWRIPGCALWSTKNVRRVGWADTTFDGDELSVRKLFHASGTIAFSKGTYYYNQANTQAITKVVHPRQLQSITTALDLRDFLHEHEYRAPLYQRYIYRAVTRFFRLAVDFRRMDLTVDPGTEELVSQALARLSTSQIRRDVQAPSTGRGRVAAVASTHGRTVFELATRLASGWPGAGGATKVR